MRFGDLTYTVTRRLGRLRKRAWLAGTIVVRIAVDQDGFAYWNLSGPNSPSAADAQSDKAISAAAGPSQVMPAAAAGRGPPLEVIQVVEARPIVSSSEKPTLAAEVAIEHRLASGRPARRTLTIRPRDQPVVVIEAGDGRRSIELESFDLFASASVAEATDPGNRMRIDISAAIGRLAGVERLGRELRSVPTMIEVDDFVRVEVSARYAPYRNGSVQGEERSLLSQSITSAIGGPFDVRCDVRLVAADGIVRRLYAPTDQPAAPAGDPPALTITPEKAGHRIVIGPLGAEPTTVRLDATVQDSFGLQAPASAWVDNYRVVEPRRWLEEAAEISLDELRRRRERLDRASLMVPDADSLAAAAMIRCLVETIEALDDGVAVPACRIAGTIRLATRVAELMPPIARR